MKSKNIKTNIISFLLLTQSSFAILAHPGHAEEELIPASGLQFLFDSTGFILLVLSVLALYRFSKEQV